MSEPESEPRDWAYEQIAIGQKEERVYVASVETYTAFLRAFDDRSPIHVDEDYARAAGFDGKVMHGAMLNGFLSHFIGMHFPGRRSLLLGMNLRFSQPVYLGDELRLEATVSQKLDARLVAVLDVIFQNLTRGSIAARGQVQVMLREGR